MLVDPVENFLDFSYGEVSRLPGASIWVCIHWVSGCIVVSLFDMFFSEVSMMRLVLLEVSVRMVVSSDV